jgi:hypothetical protein
MPLAPLSRRRKANLLTVLGDLVQTTDGKWITHPPTRCPNGHTLGPNQVLVGQGLPRARRRTHNVDVPHVRPDGLPTAEHALLGDRWDRDRSDQFFSPGCTRM